MEVILLEKVHKLGDLGDQVHVKSGYGRNYLIPGKKAVPATPGNVEKFQLQRAELVKIQAESLVIAQQRAEGLEAVNVTITSKAGAEGKLFGSVGTADIAEAISATGVVVEKKEIRLPDGALRQLGEYAIDVQLHSDVTVIITVVVAAED